MTPATTLRPVGFFSDMHLGETWATTSLARSKGQSTLSPAELERVVTYLRAGRPFLEAMVMLEDPLDPGGPFLGPGLIQCDGVWAWPAVLAVLLPRHRPALPDDFIQRALGQHPRQEDVDAARFTLPGLVDEDGRPTDSSCG